MFQAQDMKKAESSETIREESGEWMVTRVKEQPHWESTKGKQSSRTLEIRLGRKKKNSQYRGWSTHRSYLKIGLAAGKKGQTALQLLLGNRSPK